MRYTITLSGAKASKWKLDNRLVADVARIAEETEPELRGYFNKRRHHG
jgi:hypothetical protein